MLSTGCAAALVSPTQQVGSLRYTLSTKQIRIQRDTPALCACATRMTSTFGPHPPPHPPLSMVVLLQDLLVTRVIFNGALNGNASVYLVDSGDARCYLSYVLIRPLAGQAYAAPRCEPTSPPSPPMPPMPPPEPPCAPSAVGEGDAILRLVGNAPAVVWSPEGAASSCGRTCELSMRQPGVLSSTCVIEQPAALAEMTQMPAGRRAGESDADESARAERMDALETAARAAAVRADDAEAGAAQMAHKIAALEATVERLEAIVKRLAAA